MTSFEKFHPVLTAHYTLDWLTQTPVKQVDNLFNQPAILTTKADNLPTQILDTVKSINRVMQKVMNDAELTWGITDSETNQFVGIVTISGFDRPNRIGRIDFIIDQQAANASKEMIERALKFIVDHFNFKKVQVELTTANQTVINALTTLGFSQVAALTFETSISTSNI
ncbi:GNAT family N-acetyltransferase [Lentilactobacillus kisonensis]|uniref:N-acetyltransferase domain-containing protein n=1 Tax=Lentilactobacillus kisonensis F0435 TaxID=797516 RepID=H1LHX4_9LACO|nr:GNAT family N-acetyltransferase [Lentilactobacillus kisonensis]EHO50112.1 hypothetical protein HMPREF9104_02215 [Lentilactobacillus kisonensis F0435]